jgi:hypothetical protein
MGADAARCVAAVGSTSATATPQTVPLGAAIEVSGAGAIAVGGSGKLTVTRGTAEEVAILKLEVEMRQQAREDDAAAFRRELAAQRDELRAHAIAVTQQGWQYILSGAGCSAFGTFLALVG